MQRQLMLLWGSRGVFKSVLQRVKGNMLASALYMTGLFLLSLGQSDSPAVKNFFREFIPIMGLLEFALVAIFFLATSLYLWARPIVVREFARRLAAGLLTLIILAVASGILLIVSSGILPATVSFFMSVLSYVLVMAYSTCVLARVPVADSFNLRIPQRIFVAIVILTTGQYALDIILYFTLGYLSDNFVLVFLQLVIMAAISTFIFVAAMTAFARHCLKI